MILLLDPILLTPPNRSGSHLTAPFDFWQRIIEWSGDGRVQIGEEVHALIANEYAQYGYPDKDLSIDVPELRREYQAAISRLLSRVHFHTRGCGERSMHPAYRGSDEQSLALQMDISGSNEDLVRGLATDDKSWQQEGSVEQIVFDPPIPPSLEVCIEPHAELLAERNENIRGTFSGKRLHVVGGQPDRKVIDSLCSRFGLPRGDIVWTPCEKAKPPRDLDKRWRSLDAERDITICVTGRVGHATSAKAAEASRKASVRHYIAETASEIEQLLIDRLVGQDHC